MRGMLLAAVAALALAGPAAAATNLVTNGGFETGTFAGWTQTGSTAFTAVLPFIGPEDGPTEGVFQAVFGQPDAIGTLEQDVATEAGGRYRVSFDLYNYSAGFPGAQNVFRATFGDAPLLFLLNAPAQDYTSYAFHVTAGADTSRLFFDTFHAPSFWLLDNVAVQAIPEPAAWAAMIAGFGLVGAELRRRRQILMAESR